MSEKQREYYRGQDNPYSMISWLVLPLGARGKHEKPKQDILTGAGPSIRAKGMHPIL